MGEERSPEIHKSAVVSGRAQVAQGVRIGPYAVIGDDVTIGEGTVVGPLTVIEGPTIIGKGNRIIGQSAIGTIPQDLKFQGEETFLSIGDENIIREFVTINRGTAGGGGKTTIGNGNLLMTGVHIAHDCHVGKRTVLANSATLAGHVEIEDDSTVGAFSGVHQDCRVGVYAFVGGYSVLTSDALPFVKTVGYRNQARIYGINSMGLERKNFSSQRIGALKKAYRWLFHKGLKLRQAIDQIRKEELEREDVSVLLEFIESSRKGFVRTVSSSGRPGDS